MSYFKKILKYYPIIAILQIPLIIGFILPIILYNNFYYTEFEIKNNSVSIAKNYYLTFIFIFKLIMFFYIVYHSK